MNAPAETPAATIRRLVRSLDRAYLATLGRADGQAAGEPYASLVLAACLQDASPVLLISTLADHTKNLLADPRASLLFDGTAGLADPLTGARAGLQGRLVRDDGEAARARYLARHPGAAMYAGFKDFAFWRMEIRAAHLVAGFGRIHWLDAAAVRDDVTDAAALVAAEREVVAHMNADHAEAVQLYTTRLLGRSGDGWVLTGVDPEGADLRRGGEVARLAFDKRAADAEAARVELVRLVKRARTAT
jgi:putative heme iron utilization protein